MFAKLSTELPSCSYLGCHHSEFEAITNRFGNPEKGDTTHRREDIYEFHSADRSSSHLFVPTGIRDALDLVRLSLSQCLTLASTQYHVLRLILVDYQVCHWIHPRLF